MKVTVGKDGTIEIPLELQESLGLRPGTYCRVLARGDDLVLQRLEDVHLHCLTLRMGTDTIHSASSTQDE